MRRWVVFSARTRRQYSSDAMLSIRFLISCLLSVQQHLRPSADRPFTAYDRTLSRQYRRTRSLVRDCQKSNQDSMTFPALSPLICWSRAALWLDSVRLDNGKAMASLIARYRSLDDPDCILRPYCCLRLLRSS